jgi:hypothetical protein
LLAKFNKASRDAAAELIKGIPPGSIVGINMFDSAKPVLDEDGDTMPRVASLTVSWIVGDDYQGEPTSAKKKIGTDSYA